MLPHNTLGVMDMKWNKLNLMKVLVLNLALALQVGCQEAKGSSALSATANEASAPLVVIALVKVKPGNEAAFAAAARSILIPTRAEAGNISYDFHQSATDAGEFATFELWDTAEQLDAHMHAQHMQKFFGIVGPMFEEGYPQIKTYRKLTPSL